MADLQYEKARSVADEVKMLGSDALAIGVNVAEEGSVQHLAEATFADFGRIDILVNDAGVYIPDEIVKRLSLIDRVHLEWIGVEDGLADVTERTVNRVRKRMNSRRLAIARDHDARALMLSQIRDYL